MTVKRKGLGRGLDALLGPAGAARALAEAPEAVAAKVDVDLLQRGRYQPRQDMHKETLEALADSIRVHGLMQPIIVRPMHGAGERRYEIIAGERRWRAAQMAGVSQVPVIVRDVPDEIAVAMSLIENIQREDLNPLEEARALERLVNDFGMTHQEAADSVSRSRAAVSNLLRLLELHDDVKGMVERRELDMGHARALLALPRERQPEAGRQVLTRGLSARATERLVKRLLAPNRPAAGRTLPPDPDVRRLEGELGEKLGARVSIQHGARGKGKLTVAYNSLEELEGILAHIK